MDRKSAEVEGLSKELKQLTDRLRQNESTDDSEREVNEAANCSSVSACLRICFCASCVHSSYLSLSLSLVLFFLCLRLYHIKSSHVQSTPQARMKLVRENSMLQVPRVKFCTLLPLRYSGPC